jgi:hypothetical protein
VNERKKGGDLRNREVEERRKTLLPEIPGEIQIFFELFFRHSDILAAVQAFRRPAFRLSGFQAFRLSGFQAFRLSGFKFFALLCEK